MVNVNGIKQPSIHPSHFVSSVIIKKNLLSEKQLFVLKLECIPASLTLLGDLCIHSVRAGYLTM